MSKPEQVAVLEPRGELRFKGPFTEVTTARLQIKNPTDRALAFKVKTTAPKRYCVRPNNGLIPPSKSVDIAVMLQPFDFETHSQERNKHKFMVQTMYVPDGEYLNSTDALWRDARPDEVMDSKLKCVFDMPGMDSASNSGDQNENENQVNYALSSAMNSDQQSQRSGTSGFADPSAPPPPYSSSLNNGALEQETERLNEENRVLRDQLSAARREVVTLKEDSLRQRKLAAGSTPSSVASGSSSGVSSSSPRGQQGIHNDQAVQGLGGYPPIVVAIVALVLGLIFGKLLL